MNEPRRDAAGVFLCPQRAAGILRRNRTRLLPRRRKNFRGKKALRIFEKVRPARRLSPFPSRAARTSAETCGSRRPSRMRILPQQRRTLAGKRHPQGTSASFSPQKQAAAASKNFHDAILKQSIKVLSYYYNTHVKNCIFTLIKLIHERIITCKKLNILIIIILFSS